MTTSDSPIFVIVPCSGDKGDTPAAARDLYTGRMFRRSLEAAESGAFGDDPIILVLSALHGLVTLDQVVAPYDMKMGRKGSVTADTVAAQAVEMGIDWGSEVFSMMPKAYFEVLDEALRTMYVYPADCYEGEDRGVGDHRHMLRCAVEFSGQAVAS